MTDDGTFNTLDGFFESPFAEGFDVSRRGRSIIVTPHNRKIPVASGLDSAEVARQLRVHLGLPEPAMPSPAPDRRITERTATSPRG